MMSLRIAAPTTSSTPTMMARMPMPPRVRTSATIPPSVAMPPSQGSTESDEPQPTTSAPPPNAPDIADGRGIRGAQPASKHSTNGFQPVTMQNRMSLLMAAPASQ